MIKINSTQSIFKDNRIFTKQSSEYFTNLNEVINFHNNVNVSKSQRECEFIVYLDKLQEYALKTYKKHSADWFLIAKKCDFIFDQDTNFDVSELKKVTDPNDNTKSCLSLKVRMRDADKFGFSDWSESFLINEEDVDSLLWIDNASAFAKEFNDDELLMDILKVNGAYVPNVWVA